MKKKETFDLFISHATADRVLAAALRDLICNTLKLEKNRVFVSSDGESIRLGQKDEPQITEAHKAAKAVIALMTPRSIFRPWVVYETGGANFHSSKPLFVVLSNGATVESLPAPLKVWHTGSLVDRVCLNNLCDSLGDILRRRYSVIKDKDSRRVTELARHTIGDWESVNVSLVAEQAARSPFAFQNILDGDAEEGARKDIYVFGLNLHFLTRGQSRIDFLKLTLNWLQADAARQFTAVITDYRCAPVVDAWERVWLEDFARHLTQSRKAFKHWRQAATARGLAARLRLFVTDFIPTTAVFVDPNETRGYMVLTPIGYRLIPAEKPHFIVGRRQNKVVFDHYWNAFYERVRDKCRPLT